MKFALAHHKKMVRSESPRHATGRRTSRPLVGELASRRRCFRLRVREVVYHVANPIGPIFAEFLVEWEAKDLGRYLPRSGEVVGPIRQQAPDMGVLAAKRTEIAAREYIEPLQSFLQRVA